MVLFVFLGEIKISHTIGRSQLNLFDYRNIFIMSNSRSFFVFFALFVFPKISSVVGAAWKPFEDRSKCPNVKGLSNFDLSEFVGSWKIIQYYASSEEALAYKCMRAELFLSEDNTEITMNFTYSFVDDPINEKVFGNITWKIPFSHETPAHWVHAEFPYEEIYNTYVLATEYKSWALLMHCAEKKKSPKYLSSFIMSRKRHLGPNVISYLREKLPRYDIDLEYMFPMEQKNCNHTFEKPNSFGTLPMVEAARNRYEANEYSKN